MKLAIDPHAVQRYQERHAPHLTAAAACVELEVLVERAARIRDRTLNGDELWYSGDVVMVVKYDASMRLRLVITVLPKRAAIQYQIVDPNVAEFEEFQRLQAESDADRAEMLALVKKG